ncbi:GntR family transcriptional regulator [Cupriavidus basilensis]|uniref:GntR family transcriptional regulator n=1 Tax=Cupriavidus basilensis TaxID=68895 RepID=UPI002846286C|nr:GntR family transcriptional regulator [Cupriavidus basilensis]MDR3380130.1 GntR family transcriptional regulator [Cupriavidus basilensis]
MTFATPSMPVFSDATGHVRSSTSAEIAERITQSILAQRLAPGTRLGEQALAGLFSVSRTLVREALTRLAARGIVTVSARRGWFVIEPSRQEARQAFAARRAIELGLLRYAAPVSAAAIGRLQEHVEQEQRALSADDAALRSYLLGDFHVCLGECVGNVLLADTLRDLTARTTLIAMRYQSSHQANESCAEHVLIVAALAAGDTERAIALMDAHLCHVEAGLSAATPADPPDPLRQALSPLGHAA